MNENSEKLTKLFNWMDDLSRRQLKVNSELNEIRFEIEQLKAIENEENVSSKPENEVEKVLLKEQTGNFQSEFAPEFQSVEIENSSKFQSYPTSYSTEKRQNSTNAGNELEKFIGENLISKIGIIITVIGVAIGTKYAIDHQLISPLTRIILGYLFGFGLLGIAFRLKKDYENYSAVLLSGSMAILYFLTYAAYSFYQLMPQIMAFALMVMITALTVVAAIKYDKQIISHFGLVGAYAVPFLLSENSGNVLILYSYMAIINIGILVISFKKYWKPLFYSSFILTWIMYLSWYKSSYQMAENFELAITFLIIFFTIFYASFLAYKLRKNELFERDDILLLLSNSFLFYGIGFSILDNHETGKQLLGFFTVCNALIHFAVSSIIYKQKLADKNMFYLVSGLFLVFITIAIPVQLDGNWVTLLWAGEAALLFWIGRTKSNPVYEILSYPLMLLALFSIIQDWATGPYMKQPHEDIVPLLNINFLTSILFLAAFGFLTILNRNKKYSSPPGIQEGINELISFAIPAIFLSILYFSLRMEIESFFQQQLVHSESINIVVGQTEPVHAVNVNILKFKSLWIMNYSLLFLTILSFFNIRKLKNQFLAYINLILNTLAIFLFLIADLYILGELREKYLHPPVSQFFPIGTIYIGIRYISLAFFALLIFATYKYVWQKFLEKDFKMNFDILLYTCILWVGSSELIHWIDIAGSTQSYKLGLSILWGVYSLLLISIGIWKKKKHLRIGAIVLFGGTLIKLFLYDISDMETISKTIVFVSLGILLLIISFLYNKFRNIISEETKI
ncbi:MAG: DUF2339 domain-containing protein [Bacteroidia bacterium]